MLLQDEIKMLEALKQTEEGSETRSQKYIDDLNLCIGRLKKQKPATKYEMV